MSSRKLINLFLIIFALGTLVALVKYTHVLDNGIAASLHQGVANIERIIWGKAPASELTSTEKDRLVENLDQTKKFEPLYCGSSYFPFIPGASWNYQTKSPRTGSGVNSSDSDTIRLGVPAPENGRTYLDGQLLSRSGWTNRTIAICEEGKIRLTDWNFLMIFARDRTVTTPCQGGQYNFSLPKDADLIKGNGWLEDGCLIYETLDNNNKRTPPFLPAGRQGANGGAEIKENLEVRGKTLGQESVVVPAGTFDAEKIELALTGKQEFGGNAKTVEATIDFWVARGIGVVRSVYQEKNSGRPSVVQELTGYQIPSL